MQKLLFSYLRFWAKGYLKRTKPEIIAITGSVGKTSTKEAIFSVLGEEFGDDVEKSYGNLNNETGVPMAILGYKKSPQKFYNWLPIVLSFPFKALIRPKKKILVLEYAADKPGDIKYLTDIAKPKIAVLTGIGPTHLEAFGTIEKIVEEKTDLLRALSVDANSWAILNIDDEQVKKVAYGGRYQKKTYGISEKADFTAKDIKTEIAKFKPLTSFEINLGNEKILAKENVLGGIGNIYAALAAVAIGKIYKIDNSKITAGLGKIEAEKHRLNVVRGINNSIIIDDCYNASPASVKAALNILEKILGKKKIVVLGDMRELGKISTDAHREVGKLAKEVSNDQIAIGNLAKNYGFKNYFKNTEKAKEYLLNKIGPNDIILIKASRRIGLEKLVESLKIK